MSDDSIRDYTKAELLALTPSRYLKNGFTDAAGNPVAGLETGYATAASTQLLEAQLSPQEFTLTFEAFRQTLALQSGDAAAQVRSALDEALEIVRGIIRQPNNPGLSSWLNECAAQVRRPADIEALVSHGLAVLRLYSVVAASLPD